jgi:signal transduction histidine kinase
MTQRIAAAILLTVWAVLIAGGFAAYWVTRAVLVADLDRELDLRARTLAHAAARGVEPERAAMRVVDGGQSRYVIRNEIRTLWTGADNADPAPDASRVPQPRHAGFSRLGDGRWVRTVTVQVPPADPADPGGAVTVTYSSTADALWRVLSRLALTLTVCAAAAGAGAAAVAVWVARAALRPLHAASDVVGGIDEARLDRRIDADSLPPELRPVAARLNEMIARLEAAFAQRKRFLADAAHELRTPVAALVTTLEVALRRRRDAEELTRTMQACLADARHLKRLVHVLMEHARGEASAASRAEAWEAVDAAELLGECADLAAALGVARDVRVERSLPATMPFVTQPQRLRSVVTNLLSNAVEYNRPGGLVRLEAELAGGALRVSVRDTGRGIAAEHLPYLFEPFYRAEGGGAGGGGGRGGGHEETPHLGLGLFLVQSHLKALGGRCTVESELGVGTTMHVTVPAGVAPTGRGASGAATLHPAGPGSAENKSDPSTVLEGARN